MASAVVFVDDIVNDRLPSVCIVHGGPTEGRLRRLSVVRGLGWRWLLAAVGSVGAILVDVEPDSLGVAGNLVLTILFGPAVWVLLIVLAVHSSAERSLRTAVPFCDVCRIRGPRRRFVTVSLDASNRWVTLGRVHPDFAEACRQAAEWAQRIR